MAAGDDDLRQRVEALQKDLWKSAEIGKGLLDENGELLGQLEALRKRHAAQIESLEQERHVLTMKLTNAAHMEATYCEEIESLRETVLRQRAAANHEAESRHAAEVVRLQAKLSGASARIKELEAVERAAAYEKVTLEARLAAAALEQHGSRGAASCTDAASEVRAAADEDERAAELELRQQLHEAVQCKAKLQEDVVQATSRALAAEALAHRQAEQCSALREEVEDARSQAASFGCALEKLRLENQDLRAELDVVRLMSQGHKAKGNSMFAELEDKRVEAERRIVSLLVDNDLLVAQCDQYQKQLRSLKVQMASFLQTATGSVGMEHVRQLEQRLADATARAEELARALQRHESGEVYLEASRKRSLVAAATAASAATASSSAAGSARADSTSTQPNAVEAAAVVIDVGYAQSLLKSKDEQLDRLRSELQAKRYELLVESGRLQESQRRQRDSDGLVAKLRAENVQLSVRLEDMAAAAAASSARSSGKGLASTDAAVGCSLRQSFDDEAARPQAARPADASAAASAAASERAVWAKPSWHGSRADPAPLVEGPGRPGDHAAATAAAAATATSGCHAVSAAAAESAANPDCSSRRGGSVGSSSDRHVAAATAASAAVANPRTAARLAKAEQRDRQQRPPLPTAEVVTCVQPKLTARASANDSTDCGGGSAAGGSPRRHSLRTVGPMREVSDNVPPAGEVAAEGAKVTGLDRPASFPQLSSAGSDVYGVQESCRTQ